MDAAGKRQRRGASQADAESESVESDPVATAVAAALAKQEHTFMLLLDTQTKAFQACLQASVDSVNTRMDNFLKENVRELAQLKMSVQFSQSELHDLKESVKRDTVLHKDYDKIIEQLSADIKKMGDATDYLENQSRRNNLRIDGVKERGGETWEMTEEALRRTFEHDLKMPTEQVRSLAIERAHRTGGKTDRDRTIVVKFASFKARDAVLQAARAAKPRGVYVNEDFSMRVVNRRKELIPEMRAANLSSKTGSSASSDLLHYLVVIATISALHPQSIFCC